MLLFLLRWFSNLIFIRKLYVLYGIRYKDPDYNSIVASSYSYLIGMNKQLAKVCINGTIEEETCKEPAFLEEACSRFPFVLTKVVRLRLSVTRMILDDPSLKNLKIVYLVRDPRAILSSRLRAVLGDESCRDPGEVCKNFENDLDAFDSLSKSYPDRLLLIKYESLAAQPHEVFRQVFEFAQLTLLPSIRSEITRHTSQHKDGFWSTYRNSTERIDHWKIVLQKWYVFKIQRSCSNIFKRLGYPKNSL